MNDVAAQLMRHLEGEGLSHEQAVWFATGLSAGFQIATRHPEWAAAFMQLTGTSSMDVNDGDAIVASVPIGVVS